MFWIDHQMVNKSFRQMKDDKEKSSICGEVVILEVDRSIHKNCILIKCVMTPMKNKYHTKKQFSII